MGVTPDHVTLVSFKIKFMIICNINKYASLSELKVEPFDSGDVNKRRWFLLTHCIDPSSNGVEQLFASSGCLRYVLFESGIISCLIAKRRFHFHDADSSTCTAGTSQTFPGATELECENI